MSDLWMILVLLGASIVLGVVFFNWWQEKKYRRDVEYRFGQTRSDVLESEVGVAKAKFSDAKSAVVTPAMSEDMEGWMSEPRVRGMPTVSPKIEPGFITEIKSAGKPVVEKYLPEKDSITKSSIDRAALTKLAEEVKLANQVEIIQTSPSALSLQSQPSVAEAPSGAEKISSVANQPSIDYQVESIVDDFADDAPLSLSTTVVEPSMLPVTIPAALHTKMDWVGVLDFPNGVALAELQVMQAEIRTFPQHTALWVQSQVNTPDKSLHAEQASWHNLLALDIAAIASHPPAKRIAFALQLADRGGPVSADNLQRFRNAMEAIAHGFGLQVQWQGHYAPEQQAQAIDAFCIEVDKAVEFHLLANQGMFHATKLRGLAEAAGMSLGKQGRFELVNAEGQLQFSLHNFEGKPFSPDMLKTAVMTGITFQLDIPTTANSVQVFDHMVEVARTMAQSLNASMIDVNRKPIVDAQLDKIRQQLKSITATMVAQDILSGSSHAKRLFS